jgi:hypothetical protein
MIVIAENMYIDKEGRLISETVYKSLINKKINSLIFEVIGFREVEQDIYFLSKN